MESAGHDRRPVTASSMLPAWWTLIELNPEHVTEQRRVLGKRGIETARSTWRPCLISCWSVAGSSCCAVRGVAAVAGVGGDAPPSHRCGDRDEEPPARTDGPRLPRCRQLCRRKPARHQGRAARHRRVHRSHTARPSRRGTVPSVRCSPGHRGRSQGRGTAFRGRQSERRIAELLPSTPFGVLTTSPGGRRCVPAATAPHSKNRHVGRPPGGSPARPG